jgi:uncharacterized protein YlxW (UPF0749 family)
MDLKIDPKKIRGIFSDISKASEKVVGSVTINPLSRSEGQKSPAQATKMERVDKISDMEEDIEDLKEKVRRISKKIREMEEIADHK